MYLKELKEVVQCTMSLTYSGDIFLGAGFSPARMDARIQLDVKPLKQFLIFCIVAFRAYLSHGHDGRNDKPLFITILYFRLLLVFVAQ